MEGIEDRLSRIERMLAMLVERQTVKDWYTTAEVGEILGKSEYTVREWCRQGRVRPASEPSAGVAQRNGSFPMRS